MSQLFQNHLDRLEAAVDALRSRRAFTPFTESPSGRLHPPNAHARGREAFEARLGTPFDGLDLPGQVGWIGGALPSPRVAADSGPAVGGPVERAARSPAAAVEWEESPYTRRPLGIAYPQVDVRGLYAGIGRAWEPWRLAEPAERVGVCLEMLARWEAQVFENTYATMHTTGQAFMLAFAGSGASSLDRGLEALAAAWVAMSAVTREATYERTFGAHPVRLEKSYRLMPVGVAVVLSCGSYPAWNAYPAMLANLATGNPVVLKPHPATILPMAIAVETGRAVLRDAGFDPNLLTLAVDTWAQPVAKKLFRRPETAIIDFTGGQVFGAWIERHCWRQQVYTETAGCNAVLLESAVDLDAALGAIAYGLVLFSGQMCTAPQNIWVPADGVLDGAQRIGADEVERRLIAHIDALVATSAPALCGALHSERTADELRALTADAGDRVLRAPTPYAHPEYPAARTATPLLIRTEPKHRKIAQSERFGPVAFLIRAPNRDAALQMATADAAKHGAIASYAYTTDREWLREVEEAFALAGASVGINLVRQRPMNFTAAFSDYHVTGLNPAGNACLTDAAFVSRRFRIVQSKREEPQ